LHGCNDDSRRARQDWRLLTDAANYTKWNSTLTSLEGDMIAGKLPDFKAIFERYAADLKRAAENA